MRKDNSSI